MNAENIVLLLLMLKNRIYILVTMAFLSVIPAYAQVNQQIAPEDREVDMDNPTFEPMVKVGKVLMGSDSIRTIYRTN